MKDNGRKKQNPRRENLRKENPPRAKIPPDAEAPQESRERVTWEGAALLAPVPPVLVTVGDMEESNILTVGWTGILASKPPKTYISVKKERHSYNIIKEKRAFVINLPTAEMVKSVDLCGVKSGKSVDKFSLCRFDKVLSKKVTAPTIAQCPIALECKVDKIVTMGSHDMFVADIVAVSVDPAMLDRTGRLMIERCNLLAYAHGTYFPLGKPLGTFGFSVRKPAKNRKR